jgi:two-component system chemotaxis sensor kinase CheA
VLALEENPTDADAVNSVFRVFHTFKGSAGFLKFDAMQRFAHDLESLLDAARSGSLAVSRAVIDAILKGGDVLSSCMREVGAQLAGDRPGTPIAVPSAQVLEMIRLALAPDRSPPAEAAPVATARVAPSGERVETAVLQTQAPAAEQAKSAPRDAVAASEATSIRVDAAKLDDMVNLVGELVIAQSMVIGAAEGSQLADVDRDQAMRSLMRITRELQRNATTLRMVPISGLFRKMTRLVRDLSAQVGKQVRLELIGEDTELDRQLVDRMGDPLLHMIRNAVDHGVELPAERQAAGKDAIGIVRLSAAHESGGVVIRVADDGRGLDGDRLLAKALEKGLIKGDGPRSLAERLELIFLPGFSTASAVTDISGRGVGMDVVRRHIEGLRGAIDIASTVGVGTTFTIRLPLTLALIDGLLVRVGGERYVLPTLAVRECFRPEPGAVSAVHEQGEIVNLRGHQIPVLRLGAYLQKAAQSLDPCEGILVVIEAAGSVRAVLVDELLGKQDMIIKKLGNTFDGNPVVSGGAVLGDGSVGLILSADALVRATREVAA